jgi:hypothetical protein
VTSDGGIIEVCPLADFKRGPGDLATNDVWEAGGHNAYLASAMSRNTFMPANAALRCQSNKAVGRPGPTMMA